MKSKKIKAPVCENCAKWKTFGEECRFFWEGKRACSKWGITLEEERYKVVDGTPYDY